MAEVSEEVAAWLDDPVTKQFTKDVEEQCAKANLALMSSASESTDPRVRAAYSHYQTLMFARGALLAGKVK